MKPWHSRRRVTAAALASALVALAGCGGNGADAAAAPAGGAGGAPGGGPGGGGPGGGGPGGRRPPLVLAATDVATIARGPIEAGIPLSGDLRPIQTLVVRARLEGDLERVLVRPGESVRGGQVLAVYEASLEASQRSAAEADRASARSDLSTAQWNLDQSRELLRAGAIAEREVRLAEQAVAAARARVAAADARVRATASDLTDTRVQAPMAGTVESRQVVGGERVARGAELFTIVREDVLELAGAVPERVAAQVRPGLAVRLDVGGRRVTGRVARVSPTVDPTTRGVTVFVEVPNPGRALKGNTFATGRAVGRVVEGALLVPTVALRQTQEQAAAPAGAAREGAQGVDNFVYRIRGQSVERVNVALGIVDEQAGLAEVVDGLAEGDRVIVGNIGAVGRGVTVQILGGGERASARGAGGAGGAAGEAGGEAGGSTARASAAANGGGQRP